MDGDVRIIEQGRLIVEYLKKYYNFFTVEYSAIINVQNGEYKKINIAEIGEENKSTKSTISTNPLD